MSSRLTATVLVIAVFAACFLSVPMADVSNADTGVDVAEIRVHTFTDSLEFKTGNGDTVTLVISNNSTADGYQIQVQTSISPSTKMHADVSDYAKSLDPGKSQTVTVDVSADSTAVSGDRTLTITVTVTKILGGEVTEGAMEIPVKVNSNYSSEGYYNKIMGIFPSPFTDPIIAAALTLLVWVGIAIVMNIAVRWILTRMARKDGNDELRKDARSAGFFVMVLVLLFGIPAAIRVWGIDERIVATVSDIVAAIIALNIAYIVWKIYKVVAYDIIVRRDSDNRIDDSLYPLVKMIGKIIVTVVTLSYILSVYGMDLGTIVTSAGIATLAISLGAQSTLNQFFCGLVLLVTRPFRIGDKVRLGTSTEVLIVRKIGVMETEFKVWLNEEIQHIPNSTVMGNSIINITKGDKTYKVVDFIEVDYDSDLDKVRDVIMSILTVHPKIVNDGSKSPPDFRVYSMEDSSLKIRISYIVYDHEVWHAVSSQVKEAIYKKFVVEGIKVPHNIIDVHTE